MSKITIDQETCIGCGACVAVVENLIEMDYDAGKAKVKKEELTPEEVLPAKEAAEICPVQSIKVED